MKNYLLNPQNRLKLIQEIELSILMFLACCYAYLQVPILATYGFFFTFLATILAPFILPSLYKILENALLFFFRFLNTLNKGSGELLTFFYKEGRLEFFTKHNNLIIELTDFRDSKKSTNF